MKREIIQTSDGSTTIHLHEWGESYHSKHGAIQEAYHVFIQNGFRQLDKESVSILEIGFGTGLNCFITFLESQKNNRVVDYVGVEAFPVAFEEVTKMNYPELLETENRLMFNKIHEVNWEVEQEIVPNFSLTKRKQMFHDIDYSNRFDLIYFDAFGYRVQPELWTEEIFSIMYRALKPGGLLVTYACRTVIKSAMINSGFTVEKLPGAPGKREMLRATK